MKHFKRLLPSVLLLFCVFLRGENALGALPLVYWNNHGHCVEQVELKTEGISEIIVEPSRCHGGKKLYLSDGRECNEITLKTKNLTSTSSLPMPYELSVVSSYHCSETKPIYWLIGNMTCSKRFEKEGSQEALSERVGIENCPQGIRPYLGECRVDTHFDSNGNFVRSRVLNDPTPCQYTRYLRFGKTCYQFLAKKPNIVMESILSQVRSFDYVVHRIEDRYCKTKQNDTMASKPSKPQNRGRSREPRNHDGDSQGQR